MWQVKHRERPAKRPERNNGSARQSTGLDSLRARSSGSLLGRCVRASHSKPRLARLSSVGQVFSNTRPWESSTECVEVEAVRLRPSC